MRIGTKSLLFGFHNPLIHGWYVLRAWRVLYRSWPEPHELAAIMTHDMGYLGSPNMDGPEGESHPTRAAAWWRRHGGAFGERVAVEIIGHSRFLCAAQGLPESRLLRADKLAISLYPVWLAMLLYHASGEIHEYRQRSDEGRYENTSQTSALAWFLEMRARCALIAFQRQALAGEGKSQPREVPHGLD